MIISASRRTDIPAFHGDWLISQVKAGSIQVSNPRRPSQIRQVSLRRQDVTAFVFWTKDPRPFLGHLRWLDRQGYPFLLQITLTGYGCDIEPGLPDKDALPQVLRQLAAQYGRERIVWRYDPILMSTKYDAAWHNRTFQALCEQLKEAVSQCTFSFMDPYPRIKRWMKESGIETVSPELRLSLARQLFTISRSCGLPLRACCEGADLAEAGIEAASCIDPERIAQISGQPVAAGRDRGQRPGCHCSPSIDIGTYGTCGHGCRYCYAAR